MRLHVLFQFLILGTMNAAPLLGAENTGIGKDLKATIALQGQACNQIASTVRKADSDYLVTCKDGNRYHVFVNSQGRVVVEKQ